jgi:hypothetical protein
VLFHSSAHPLFFDLFVLRINLCLIPTHHGNYGNFDDYDDGDNHDDDDDDDDG